VASEVAEHCSGLAKSRPGLRPAKATQAASQAEQRLPALQGVPGRFPAVRRLLVEHHVGRFVADAEAIYSYEGTREMNTLIVGRAIIGLSAFV
jgi:alkylation response protein AidB-like acyl-CoA dehydrogenase